MMKRLAILFTLLLCIAPVIAQPNSIQVDCRSVRELIDEYGSRTLYSSKSRTSKRFSQILEPLLGACFNQEAAQSVSTKRPTPTKRPSAFSEQTIRSLISRHASRVKILDIAQRGSTTTIEYDLKPQFLMRNEWIAEAAVFKAICALQRGQGQIPHKLEFVGISHFKSDVGRKFTAPSVEIHISAANANRIVCGGGNDEDDIRWSRVSSFYKSYPIPRGASVDD